eukprot:3833131-Heterocapsa_arctica.AAC.1
MSMKSLETARRMMGKCWTLRSDWFTGMLKEIDRTRNLVKSRIAIKLPETIKSPQIVKGNDPGLDVQLCTLSECVEEQIMRRAANTLRASNCLPDIPLDG